MYPLRNERLIITISMSLLILLSTGSLDYADTTPVDLDNHWAKVTLRHWMDDGFIDSDLHPDQSISKVEMIHWINRLTGNETIPISEREVPLTRQDAAGLIAALVDSDSSCDFTYLHFFSDSDLIATAQREALNHLIGKGILQGYPDQTLRPLEAITYAEVLSLLDRTFCKRLTKPGTYQFDQIIEGAVSISSPKVILQDSFFNNNLFLTGNLIDGPITLENVTVSGNTTISSRGVYPVLLDGDFSDLTISSSSNCIAPIVLSGSYERVEILIPTSLIIESESRIKELFVSPEAADSHILLHDYGEIESLEVQSPTSIIGSGSIKEALIEATLVTCEPAIISLTLGKGLNKRMNGNILTISDKPKAIHHHTTRDTRPPSVSSVAIDGVIVTEDLPIHFSTGDTHDQIVIRMSEDIHWTGDSLPGFTLADDALILDTPNTPYVEGDMIIALPAGMVEDHSKNPNPESQIHLSFVRESSPSDYSIVLTADSNTLYTNTPIDLDISLSSDGMETNRYDHARLDLTLTDCPQVAYVHLFEDERTDLLQAGYWPSLDGFSLGADENILLPTVFSTDQPGSYLLEVKLIDLDQSGEVLTSGTLTLEVEDLMGSIRENTNLSFSESLTGFDGDSIGSTLSVEYPVLIASSPSTYQVDTLISLPEGQSFPNLSSISTANRTYYIEGIETQQLYVSEITGLRMLLKDAQDYDCSIIFSDFPAGSYEITLQQIASEDNFTTMNVLSETTCHIEVIPQMSSTYRMDSDIPSHHFTLGTEEAFNLFLQTDQLGSTGYDATFYLFDSLSQPESSIYQLLTENRHDLTVMPVIGLATPFVIAPDEYTTLPLTFSGDSEGTYLFRISLMDATTFNHVITSEIFSITVDPGL
jgi:hypothetical protein